MYTYSSFGVATAVLFALLPFATSRELFFGAINAKLFLFTAGVLALGSLVVARALGRKERMFLEGRRPLLLMLGGLVVVYAISAVQGVSLERSLFSDIPRSSGLFFLMHVVFLSYVLGRFFTSRDWQLLWRTIVLSAGLVALGTFLGKEGLGLSTRLLWMNLDIHGFTFGNSSFAGTYFLIVLVVALAQWQREESPLWRYAIAGSALLMFLSPVLSTAGVALTQGTLGELAKRPELLLGSARASSAAAFLGVVFYAGYRLLKKYTRNYQKLLFGWSALFLVGIAGGVTLLFVPGTLVQERYVELSTAARPLVWEGGFSTFTERPFFGWGVENYEQSAQAHFDNRLYQSEYLGEIWFDRAHNIIVDTLVSVGAVGLLWLMALGFVFVRVIYRASRRGVILEEEAMLWGMLPVMHTLQLQTGFDTIGSYALLGVVGGYALWLEAGEEAKTSAAHSLSMKNSYRYAGIVGITALILGSGYFLRTEYIRQRALYKFVVAEDVSQKTTFAEDAAARISSFESLRRSSLTFIAQSLGGVAGGRADRDTLRHIQEQLGWYEERYKIYLHAQPNHYRARMNYAYILLLQTALGTDRTAEAAQLLQESYVLSPENPLTYVLESYVALYKGDFEGADRLLQSAHALNPDILFTQEAVRNLEMRKERASRISVPNLTNLL